MTRLRSAVGRTPIGPPWRRLRSAFQRPTAAQLRNAGYDRDLVTLMEKVLAPNSVCVDVGAHRGAVLAHMTRLAPQARHIAVEPLPEFAAALRDQFPQVDVIECALSTRPGRATFAHVTTNAAYSGLRQRPYDRPDEEIHEITVEVRTLDDVVADHRPVRLIKIDVEGGELDVLRGGAGVLAEDRPYIPFEFGRRASAVYGATARDVYDTLTGAGLQLTTLARFLAGEPDLDQTEFELQTTRDFFFLAHPGTGSE